MGVFFVHMLKSAVCLVAFFLFFRLLLNRDTFHRFNRIAVLCILALSLVIPFCSIRMGDGNSVNRTVLNLNRLFVEPYNIEAAGQPGPVVTWVHIVLLTYLAGIVFFLCRNIYFLLRIRCLLRQGRTEKQGDGIRLVLHNKMITPFSWMNYIVISENDMKENGREIMIHEMAHVHKRHSLDLLLADTCIVFQWFNPAAWLMKQELQNIHEYEADEYVLNEGVDAKQYQLLLIKKAVGKRLYSMANSFNHNKLKKRIIMMSKQKSSPWGLLKYLYVLPVTVVAVTAFARPEISGELDKISSAKVSDLTEITKANGVIKSTVEESLLIGVPVEKYEMKGVKGVKEPVKKDPGAIKSKSSAVVSPIELVVSKTESVTKRISGIVKDPSGKPLVGAAVIVSGTKTGTVTDTEGKFVLEAPENATLTVSMIGMNSGNVKSDSDHLAIVLSPQNPNPEVPSIRMEADRVVYCTEKNGVKNATVWKNPPLIVIDGKKIPAEDLNKVEPHEIEDITVLKGDSAKQYGEEGKNGVVIVTTKKNRK
ncbi:hypothetical protein FACS1894155_06580 [Bacteroidia bacterium]|nr:hypothetical protein FACS189455_4140 [Bacteroidia bacterium]GHU89481.1 hypothetical protein FACS1894155_06580 [Bacteroidia bacterium]